MLMSVIVKFNAYLHALTSLSINIISCCLYALYSLELPFSSLPNFQLASCWAATRFSRKRNINSEHESLITVVTVVRTSFDLRGPADTSLVLLLGCYHTR